jgi:hypothetical protein
MKTTIITILTILMLTSCDNHNSVNIIVTNAQPRTITNVKVKVSMKEVCSLLSIDSLPVPIVLNERNTPIPYSYNASHDSIQFVMPIIHIKSQKTFSVNIVQPSLMNTFLRIKRANIKITEK